MSFERISLTIATDNGEKKMEYWDLYNKDGELITHRHPSDK